MALDAAAIAVEVRRARTGAGFTQAALAALTGTTQSAVSRLESGRLVPTLAVLERVAEATGRPITVVVGPAARGTDPAAAAPPRASAGRPLPSSARRAGR